MEQPYETLGKNELEGFVDLVDGKPKLGSRVIIKSFTTRVEPVSNILCKNPLRLHISGTKLSIWGKWRMTIH